MTATPWWKTAVIYQIYPRSFCDASGDGVGDLAGILSQLDYLEWLGVDCLWLSPVYPSPMADFGYDVSDYTGIDPLFGTLAEFDALLASVHARGMKLVMDFVPNHTSNEHAWFVESRATRDNPRRDWYIWADPDPNGAPPNNWLSYFGGPAWTLDRASGQYYLHNFLPEQPDLNYRNAEVRTAVFEALRFWLARGVDGFRIDVVDRMLKDPDLRDNPPNPDFVVGLHAPTTSLLRIHSEKAPGTHELIREFQAVIKAFPDRVSIGEIDYFVDPADMCSYYGDYESHELDLPFNFSLILTPWDAEAVRAAVSAYDEVLPDYAWPNYVLGNHDQHRLATRLGDAQARVAAVLLLTLRGTPTMYYGDEIGMHNVDIPQHLVQDPQGKNIPGYTRDVARTPMQWNAGPYAGFSQAEPWLPLAADYPTRNVERQRDNPASLLSLYRSLIALRRDTPALRLGRYFSLDFMPEGVFAYIRQHDEQRRLVALNLTAEARTLVISGIEPRGRILLSTHSDRVGETFDLLALPLLPDEGLIAELL